MFQNPFRSSFNFDVLSSTSSLPLLSTVSPQTYMHRIRESGIGLPTVWLRRSSPSKIEPIFYKSVSTVKRRYRYTPNHAITIVSYTSDSHLQIQQSSSIHAIQSTTSGG